jgi:hypothetical protein
VGRGDQHGGHAGPGERGHVEPVAVHRDRHQPQAVVFQVSADARTARIFEADRVGPGRSEQLGHDREGLRRAGRHHQVAGGQPGRPHPAEVARHLGAQQGGAGGVAVPQLGVGGGGERPLVRPPPARPRERAEIGQPGAQQQVLDVDQIRAGRRGWWGDRRGRGDHRAGTAPRDQPTLGDQLLVRRHDDAPGQAQLGGEVATGRQPGARGEPTHRDRLAQGDGELVAEARPGAVEPDQRLHVVSSNGRQVDLSGGPSQP